MEKQTLDPGLGEKYSGNIARMINKDGSFNVSRAGAGFNIKDIYMYLVNLSWPRFFLTAGSFYILVNFIFAFTYLIAGVDHLAGKDMNSMSDFLDAVFFSAQTLTTVGYGGMSPVGFLVSLISALEAMIGVLGFAVITGLLYGRFSHPTSRILYSKNAVVAPYKNGKALMFRIANQRKNNLMEIEANVLCTFQDLSAGMQDGQDNKFNRKYFSFKLERSSVYFLPLSWTIVHPVDEESPLWNKTPDGLKKLDMEILILIKGFDDTFSQVVHSRYSYKYDEIIWNAKFKKAFNPDNKGEIIFNLDSLHEIEFLS